MNRWQVVRQLRWLAWQARWQGGSGRIVASPIITAGLSPDDLLGVVRAGPLVAFSAGEDTMDEASSGLGVATIPMTIAVAASNDKMNMAALVGTHGGRDQSSTYGQTTSQGRGLLEVESVLLSYLGQGAADIGLGIQVRAVGAPASGKVDGQSLAVREYRLSCRCTTDPYYHPPQRVAVAGGTMSWALPPARFDRFRIVVRSASGTTPPATPTSGSAVTLASDLATSVAVSSGNAYAVFAAYDETRDVVIGHTLSEEQRYSAQERGTTAVVP